MLGVAVETVRPLTARSLWARQLLKETLCREHVCGCGCRKERKNRRVPEIWAATSTRLRAMIDDELASATAEADIRPQLSALPATTTASMAPEHPPARPAHKGRRRAGTLQRIEWVVALAARTLSDRGRDSFERQDPNHHLAGPFRPQTYVVSS